MNYLTNKPFNLKEYGPLLIDINNSVIKSNNVILPAINTRGQPIILAINCSSNSINVYAKEDWKGWLKSRFSFEENIYDDFCFN